MSQKRIELFEDLWVWQHGIALVKRIYLVTNSGPMSKDYGFRDQLRRAAVSIPTNTAEGFERASRKEYLLFLNIVKGSAGEVRSLLRVALEIGYLPETDYKELNSSVVKLSRYLSNQVTSIKNAQPH